jgi:2-methylisocitrate lyase-like PEP mutase family enzyme
MTPDRQKQLADAFRRAHRGSLLLLPNAWDAMSARQFEAAGFGAVATTSGGLAWALGYADGEKAPWRDVVAAHERIVRAVRVPVTADIEAGYGDTPAQVAKSITEILDTGVVGFNLEDGTSRPDMPVRPIENAVARIRAAREAANAAGVPAVINAGSISTSRTSASRPAASTRRCGAAKPISRPELTASIRSAWPTWTPSPCW